MGRAKVTHWPSGNSDDYAVILRVRGALPDIFIGAIQGLGIRRYDYMIWQGAYPEEISSPSEAKTKTSLPSDLLR